MSADIPMIHTWMGVRLEDMSKDELIEAVKHLGKMQDAYYSRRSIHARALGEVEMIKRGEA